MLALLRRFARRKGRIAISAIVIGNIATVAGSLNALNKAVFEIVGFRPLEYIYANMRIIVTILFCVGYVFAFYWTYNKFLSKMTIWKRLTYSFVLALGVIGIFALNFGLIPRSPKPEDLLPKLETKWLEQVVKAQAANGGIRSQALDPTSETQVWTTAQCLKAIMSAEPSLQEDTQAIKSAFNYIESARRTDPMDGWGLFDHHKHTVTEIAAWVSLAYIEAVEPGHGIWSDVELSAVLDRIQRDLIHIASRQEITGGWRPIKDESKPDTQPFTRTYSTVLAIWSFLEARKSEVLYKRVGNQFDANIRNGIQWLLNSYNKDLGWVPNPHRINQKSRFDGLTAQVLFVLSIAEEIEDFKYIKSDNKYQDAKKDFVNNKELGKRLQCHNNRIHDVDVSFPKTDFVAEGSTMLWFPWSYALLTRLSIDNGNSTAESKNQRRAAAQLREDILKYNIDELDKFVESEPLYVLAENLLCFSIKKNQTLQ